MKLIKAGEFKFSEENRQNFKKLIKRYPTKQALALPSLWMVKEQLGFISEESLIYLADKLELTPMNIYSIASFYAMFNFEPKGKYHIKVCGTLSCELRGKDEIVKFLEDTLNLKVGESNENFSLNEVECLGHCEVAPTIQINDEFFKELDLEKISTLLSHLKSNQLKQ